jgi:exodeoxyribonuclease VIII
MNAKAQIPESGIIIGMSNADYHAQPSVSSSQLKTILRSPAHYRAAYLEDAPRKEPTASMVLGSLTHTLFLEPENFGSEYIIAPDCDRRTKDGKAVYAAFQDAAEGLTIITADQLQTAQAMANAMCGHIIHEAMTGGHAEASIFWTDEQTGLACRIRPDYHIAPCEMWPTGLIIDVKTTDDARPEAFARTCVNFGYDLSAAMYCDGFQQHYSTDEPPLFLLLVVERDAPHAVACYECSPEMLDKGHAKYRTATNMLAESTASGNWPGYDDGIQLLNLPKWA